MNQTQVIALDIGGVCLQVRPERCFGLLGFRSIQEVPLELLAAVDRYERGHWDESRFLSAFRQATGSQLGDDFVRSAWNAILAAEMPDMAELIAELKERGHKVVFLSDTSPMHMAEFRRKFPAIATQVPEGIYSFVVGAKKPEPAMYAAFEADHGVPALYIDDRAVCIAGGEAAGWNTHTFESVEMLRRDLAGHGLL